MKNFEVVVIGGGPAGGHCARTLSKMGYQVLLVEQHEDFSQNNFSSAATPLETLEKFDLPELVVGSSWRKLEILSTNIKRSWKSEHFLGVVFDFAKLRTFLAQDVIKHGGTLYLGHRHIKTVGSLVYLRNKQGEVIEVTGKVIVDATGFSRSVLYPERKNKPSFLKAVGIEYLIQLSSEDFEPYNENLVFFLGHHWSPKGYAWIFPMDQYQLKVGAAWLDAPHRLIEKTKPLKHYIEKVIKEHIRPTDYQLLDVHGSVVEYSSGLNDCYYRDNIIAIGDAVSTINALGGEGIRHAMAGAEIASNAIVNYLEGDSSAFGNYGKEMLKVFRTTWNASEQLSRKVYLQYSDARIDQGVKSLKYLSTNEILDILFNYRFERYLKGIRSYLWKKFIRLFVASAQDDR